MFEIFSFQFMQKALVAGLIISFLAPVIGTFLVVRRYSLMADTISHVSLLGIAISMLLNISTYFGSIIFASLASLFIEKTKDSSRLYQESVLAMFLSGSLAASVIIISTANFNVNLVNLLFGSITTVTWNDILIISILSALVLSVIYFFYNKFLIISFDEEIAKANGLNTKLYNYLFIILVAVSISISIRIIGVLLIGALMIIPVVTAIQLKKGFKQTMLFSIFFSFLSVNLGLILSYYLSFSSGGTIVLTALFFFFCVFSFQKSRQIYANYNHKKSKQSCIGKLC